MIRNAMSLFLLCLASLAQAQYSEPFSVANKGYQINFIDDITAINWSLSVWHTGAGERDGGDYFNTTAGGKLECIDLDEEVYWESPLINTTAANPVSIKMDLTWAEFDTDVAANDCSTDYIKVEYSVNGGAYVMIPNVAGGNACATVAYPFQNPGAQFSGNISINHGGIAGGSTLKIRVKVKTNANAELVTIDNVEVPEAGVTVGCAAPTLSTVVTPVGCSNPNSGAIDLTVAGGTPGYTYSWTGGATTQDISGKPTGTYTVTVTDAASCSATISAVIGNAPTLTLTTQVLDVTCSGSMDGEISLNVSGGVPGYTYDWSNDGPENPDNDPEDLVGLGTGTYTVTVTDASGCTKTTSATVAVLPSGAYNETFSVANKGYLANWVDDFSGVNWTMSSWSQEPPAPFGRDVNDFFRTSGGVLYGEDLDQEVCWESPTIDITGASQFTIFLGWAGFDPEDYITVYYSLDGGSFQFVPNLVGGGAGTIQYLTVDNNGSGTTVTPISGSTLVIKICAYVNSNNENITIDNVNVPGSNNYCPAPEPSLAKTNVSCNGGSNGTITTTVSNGSAPFTYAWSDNGPATKNRTGLAAGTYTVTVTDANMATGTASILITEPSAIVLTETHVNINCAFGHEGSIDLTVTGGVPFYTYEWSDGQTTDDISNLSALTYTVTVTDNNACTKSLSVTITEPSPLFSYTTQVNPSNCNEFDGSISLEVFGGVWPYTYDWSNDGPENPDNDLKNLINLGTGTYTVTITDAHGCTDVRSATLTYVDNVPPTITCPPNATVSANANCQGQVGSYAAATLSDNCNPSPTVTQSPAASTVLNGHNASQTVTLTADDGNGNTATCTLTVTLKDVTPPTVTCQANVTINANANCQGTLGLYTLTGTDNCSPSLGYWQNPSDGAIISGHNFVQVVTLYAADGAGNPASCTLTVTLKDVTPPAITCPSNITVAANANCQGQIGTISPLSVSDNCNPSPVVTQSPAASTVLNGHNASQTVTLTANDNNGNTSTCTTTVTLKDVTPPVLTCQGNVTINANASCQGVLGLYTMTAIDNCTPSLGYTQSPPDGTIITGHNTVQVVTLSTTDIGGNPASCTLTVTLKDVTPPTITCPPNVTVNANASCQGQVGSRTAATLSDNCNPTPTVTQSPAASTLLSGHNAVQTVTLTANDNNGNTSTCTLSVTLKDVTPPSLTCPPNATVSANANCQGQVGSYAAATLSDNCNPSPTVTQSPAASTVLNGHNASQTVTLTANDNNGNTSTCTLTVTLKDVTPPTVTCQANVTINANANCQGTLGLYTLTGTDNCSPSLGYWQNPSDGAIISGHNFVQVVTLYAADGAGNPASCTLTVTLKDVTPPAITCPSNITVAANANCQGQIGTISPLSVSDNCNPSPVVTQSPAATTVLNGHNASQTVTLTANDNNGNTSTCTTTVTLKDVTPPVLTCQGNVTINANASCQGVLGLYTMTAIDNCTPSLGYTQNPPDGTIITGHNTVQVVTLSTTDIGGNPASCTLTVTLKDATPPAIACPSNITVAANASCQGQIGTISPSSVSDNCNPSPTVTQSPAPTTLLTGHNATQTVTLTANDNNGNSSTCTTTVTLKDVTKPVITCPANTTVAANASCQGTLGSYSATSLSDNCNPSPTATQSPAASTVLSGHNTTQVVTLTANDNNGNTATCTLTVTLKDVTKPVITCPANVTINANASCQGILTSYTPTALSDNCNPTPSVVQSPAAGSTISGHNTVQTVTLTATDVAGNTQNCTLTVTLKDVSPPAIVCKTYIANLDATGNVSITPTNVYQSGSDNCGVVNLVSVVASSFNCSNIGNNTVTLTANDGNGNTATCNATVTVRDVTPPVAKCQNVTANLGPNGTVTVPASAVNNGSTDNCSMTFTLTPNTFNCSQIGMHTVTLKATDPGGNMSTCTAKVTVRDASGPTAKCKNPTIYLDETGHATLSAAQVNNGSTDNCGIATMSIDWTEFSCAELPGSPWPVNLFLTDVNGNASTCLAYVTVKDAIAPTAVCEDVTVALGPNGKVTVYSANLAANSIDNCSVWSYSPVAKVYTTANIGPNNLTITVKDWSGNAATCVSVVTVILPSNGDFHSGGGGGKEGDGQIFDLFIYPNPTNGETTLAFSTVAEESYVLRIFDMNGRMVFYHEGMAEAGENNLRLSLDEVPAGMYGVDFRTEHQRIQKKLVVQRN